MSSAAAPWSPGYTALRNAAAWLDLRGRGKLRVTGEDRARLLHAMSTQHIQQLTPGQGAYTLFLTAQGRILSDAYVFCLADALLLDTEPLTRERLFQHLDQYIIADDAAIEDVTADWVTVSLEGPRAEEILLHLGAPLLAADLQIAEWNGIFIAQVSSTGAPGFVFFVPASAIDEWIAQLEASGAVSATEDDALAIRLEHGRARFGPDFSEANIPQDAGQMHAIHPSKGCYLGQEIVERVRSRGQVHKQLERLAMEGDEAPPPGAKILFKQKAVGEIASAAYSPALEKTLAFAILRTEARAGDLLVDGVATTARVLPRLSKS